MNKINNQSAQEVPASDPALTVTQPIVKKIDGRGKYPRTKKNDNTKIKKADVISDPTVIDIWLVKNKDPGLVYKWGRTDNDMEMMDFAAKQYIPATGNEIIVGNPFESMKCGPGERKIRGTRILMCCPKQLVDARRKQEVLKYQKASGSANNEARKLSAKSNLGEIQIEDTQKTSRESMMEPAKTEV